MTTTIVNLEDHLPAQLSQHLILFGMVKTAPVETVVVLSQSLPWFHRNIPLPTSEDIEIRICRDEASSNEDVLVQQVQLYVQ